MIAYLDSGSKNSKRITFIHDRRLLKWIYAYKKQTYSNRWPKERTQINNYWPITSLPKMWKITNGTNKRTDLRLTRLFPRGTERIQSHRRASTHWSIHPHWEQDEMEKSCYRLDWQQKCIWYGPTKLDKKLPQNVQQTVRNFIEKIMKIRRVKLIAERKS